MKMLNKTSPRTGPTSPHLKKGLLNSSTCFLLLIQLSICKRAFTPILSLIFLGNKARQYKLSRCWDWQVEACALVWLVLWRSLCYVVMHILPGNPRTAGTEKAVVIVKIWKRASDTTEETIAEKKKTLAAIQKKEGNGQRKVWDWKMQHVKLEKQLPSVTSGWCTGTSQPWGLRDVQSASLALSEEIIRTSRSVGLVHSVINKNNY